MKKYEAKPEEELQPVPAEPSEEPMVGIPQVEEETSKQGFPEEHMQPLKGLLFLGALSKNFTYAGHDFLIETLTEGETLKVGQLMAEYRGTFSESEARRAFTVAACVKAVDGYPVVTDLSPRDNVDRIGEKFQVIMQWYPPVIEYVYMQYRALETTEFSVANALKK